MNHAADAHGTCQNQSAVLRPKPRRPSVRPLLAAGRPPARGQQSRAKYRMALATYAALCILVVLSSFLCGAIIGARALQHQQGRRGGRGHELGAHQRGTPPPPLLSISSSHLSARLQLARLDANGSLIAPPAATFALLEVGCSDRDLLVQQLDSKPFRDGAFLVSLEPLLDKYGSLLARYGGGGRDRGVRLGYYHPRAVALPLAVSAHGQEATLIVHKVAGCSSLRPLNPHSNHSRLCQSGEIERRRVPTITLAQAISLIPEPLPIRLLSAHRHASRDEHSG